ncbi:hypothetical protein [Nonomuraea sp. NPDC049709]|uniref:hypothetical protein n=1 Tax=Nonomuraea sp. NPDC049709 TaxID=3154736 RepID=UPI003448942F
MPVVLFGFHAGSGERDLHDFRAARPAHDRARHSVHHLPDDTARRCVELVAALGVSFGAIDLILTPGGEYVFLEINPNGQWGWIEDLTGLPISTAIADWLTAEETDPR